MKKIITLLALVMVHAIGFAQYDTAPQKMSYQAIIRNSNNELVKNTTVSLKLSILAYTITGEAIYIETHSTQTNENGLLVIQIGGGQAISGTFTNGIYWGMPYFLKTEIDLLGGTNYTITSTSELLSVPVSNYAHVSGALHGPAWDFVGIYKGIPYDEIIYYYISYMGTDRIALTIKEAARDRNGNGSIDFDEEVYDKTYFGKVLGNVITLPLQGDGSGAFTATITKNGNDLQVSWLEINDEEDVWEMVKQ